MRQQPLVQIDPTTGEQLEFTLVAMPAPRARIKEGWFMIFQDGLTKLAADGTLTARQLRVLMFLMSKLSFENYIHVPNVDIAKGTGIAKTHVSDAVSVLKDKGILLAGPKVGRVVTLRLSDTFGWKGRVRSLQEERKKRMRLVHSDSTARDELEKHGQRRLDETS
jgi:DNA-binding MarR family transcriptional regulator